MEKSQTVVTFPVSDVEAATEPLPEIPYRKAVERYLDGPVEVCWKNEGTLVKTPQLHPLLATLHAAFASHHPVILSPDIIWLTIVQGLAIHINENADALRHLFVAHKGQVKIEVRRPDFVKGPTGNPWEEVIASFSKEIRKHTGVTYELIAADFSTTGEVERIASEIVLLDSMQSYFVLELMTLCGIPEIALEGTVEDWGSMLSRVKKFTEFGMDWWVKPLEEVLQQFVAAASGDVDKSFWESIYKKNGPEGSGTPEVSGWINILYPYSMDVEKTCTHKRIRYSRSPFLEVENMKKGRPIVDFPGITSSAPFKWKYFDKFFDMEFVGGLIGVSQNKDTLALRPEVGWAIREAKAFDLLKAFG